jgi:predicted double-glycine peptidase
MATKKPLTNLARTTLPTGGWQEKLSSGRCGPASLKIVADYFGIPRTEDELARLCRTHPELGTTSRRIAAAARKLGFSVVIKDRAAYRDISFWLSNGIPVIVDWFSRGRRDYLDSDVADGHYSVVVGLTPTEIILDDPEIGTRRIMPRASFLRVWFDFRGRQIRKCSDIVLRQLIAAFPEN